MRTIQGTVISTKMDKTIVVSVVTEKSHPKYHKKYKVTKKFYAHDEAETVQEGDQVTIQEIRPLSKLKRWAVTGDPMTRTSEKQAPAKKPVVKKTPAAKKTPAKKSAAKKPAAAKKTTTTKKPAAKKTPAANK